MTVTCIGPGAYRVDAGGKAHVVYVAEAPGRVWAFSDGQLFVERESASRDADAGRSDASAGSDVSVSQRGPASARSTGRAPLTSPMPGTVRKILVEPGASVKAGDIAIIMEAMKMELALQVMDDGVVAEVKCRTGELVDADAELVTFRPGT